MVAAGNGSWKLVMPASSHAFRLLRTYTWLAGSSPTRTVARPGRTERRGDLGRDLGLHRLGEGFAVEEGRHAVGSWGVLISYSPGLARRERRFAFVDSIHRPPTCCRRDPGKPGAI